jgi:hypothetical protein
VIFADLIRIASALPTDVSALESSISALESAVSALEIEIKTLERSLPWEYAASVFTAVVVLGVALEFWVIRHDFRDDREAWAIWYFLGSRRLPSRPSRLKLWVEVASLVLITLGIAGELWVGIETDTVNVLLRGKSAELRSKNAELRSKSDQLLTLVTQKAGNAATSATEAKEAAASAKSDSKAAEATAGRASKLAGLTQAEARELTIRLLKAANQLTQVERRVRTQGPRWQWLEDNKSAFINSLKPFPGSITTVRCEPAASTEQVRVESDLFNFFKEGAGWSTTNIAWRQCSTFGFWGFLVIWSESSSTGVNNSAMALFSVLKRLSFPTFAFRVGKPGKTGFDALGSDSPFAKAASDPATIFVVVGPNSMEDIGELEHPTNNSKPNDK